MSNDQRRKLLKLMGSGAVLGSVPASIQRALAIPANHRTGTIEDVEHIVILMQENRSFDHYFGTLRGVRGFGDPRAVKLPSGQPVWAQPDGSGGYVLPFRPPVADLGATFLPDPPHGWNDTHAAWNGGRHDQWVPYKKVGTMTHNVRSDLPYHFALADAFTICDAYHCSLMGPTDPNRYHMWTGWVGNDGKAGGPVITNAEVGYDWSTYPERLQRAGISWKVYQDVGVGLDAAGFWGWTDDPYIGNYGDNSLLYFHQYQNAQPGDPLADYAKIGTNIAKQGNDPMRLVKMFREDVLNNRLPQVSYIVAPETYTEHPNWASDFGAWYISQFLDALTANPEVWSKTVFFLNYDEEGGFFDHMVPPTPPASSARGKSTVDTVNEIFPGDGSHPSAPYGLGMRVPMIVVSPWSKGGWVDSEVFDHTSIIRFMEARFAGNHSDLIESNITPWRRAVVGDLTSAFDFAKPHRRFVSLPSTAAFVPPEFNLTPPKKYPDYVVDVPAEQSMPSQEPGVRPARPLPYALHAFGTLLAGQGQFQIDFRNIGEAAAVFQVRDGANDPRTYTVEPGKSLSDTWSAAPQYDLSVYGPNGFMRGFKGSTPGGVRLDVRDECEAKHHRITLHLRNVSQRAVTVKVTNRYSGKTRSFELRPGARAEKSWNLRPVWGWYDLVVTVVEDDTFEYQFAGHIENGRPSISDPMLGGLRWPTEKPADDE